MVLIHSMRIWLVMLCRRVFFHPLKTSSSSLPLSPFFFLCRSRDLCALYYCLAMRPNDLTLLQSCARMQRIHSLRGINSMKTGLEYIVRLRIFKTTGFYALAPSHNQCAGKFLWIWKLLFKFWPVLFSDPLTISLSMVCKYPGPNKCMRDNSKAIGTLSTTSLILIDHFYMGSKVWFRIVSNPD